MTAQTPHVWAAIIAVVLLQSVGGAGVVNAAELVRSDASSAVVTERAGDTTTLTQQVVDGLLKLRERGAATFPAIYGGIASGADGDDDVLVVYLTSLDAQIEHEVLRFAGVPAEKVRFEDAVMSRLDAEALDARFSADVPSLTSAGYELRSWGIGRDVAYEVQLAPAMTDEAAALDEQARALEERYGPGLRVSRLEAEAVLTGRADDHPQWYGGDFINSTRTDFGVTSYHYCTSAFPLTNPAGNSFILTAGHCYVPGERIYNGIPPSYGIGGWNRNLIGTLYTRTFNTGYPDAGLIAADGSRGMWTGSSAAPTRPVTIDALIDPWPGMPLCIDGAYEGEVCSLTVGNPDHPVCIGSAPCFPHQATTDGWTAQAIGDGDSGAPLYATIDGTTYGVGIASSATGSRGDDCNNWTAFHRLCSSGVNIQNIGPILTQWGLSLDP